MRSLKISPALACLLITVAACAPGIAKRSYPARPFTSDNLAGIQVGMTPDVLVQLFGSPDSTYTMQFGQRTDAPWSGVAYRYYASRDTLYQYVDYWKKNVFYFSSTPSGFHLNHWMIEHEIETQ